MASTKVHDLFIIGGGVNGCGIARDAAGRGLSTVLAEMGDLAGATSSASTKLFHGGLRYLEFFEFSLVRKALKEREVLLVAMPHISWPMRFVLAVDPAMRFPDDTPTSRLLARFMPWLKGRRPAWLIRLGLFIYDHLGGRRILPGTERLNLAKDPAGTPLKPGLGLAYEYSDCWVEDARLVALNARDAAERGATVLTRARVTRAERTGDHWSVTVERGGAPAVYRARVLVNASGPWVQHVLHEVTHIDSPEVIRLVRGSHIVTRRLFDHDKCYFFQGADGRIIFSIPYEEDFTLIGTTDVDHGGDPAGPTCSPAEVDYLCAFASQYFRAPVRPEDVVWTYAGVRPLHADATGSATAATRDYLLTLDTDGPPLLSVFGGKITTYRKLAEAALDRIAPYLAPTRGDWTARVPLAGGDFAVGDRPRLARELAMRYPFLDGFTSRRLTRAYGTEAAAVLGPARSRADLGRAFGAGLSEAEVRWLMAHEFALTAEDVVWRRSKLGLRMTPDEIAALDDWMKSPEART